MISRIFNLLSSLRFLPHIIVFYSARNRDLLEYERDRWLKLNRFKKSGIRGFLQLLITFPEYRSLLYFRTNSDWLNFFAKGQTNLYFHMASGHIGRGLVIWHGYSTVLNANQIGDDFQVWQNVTVGKKSTGDIDDRPKIGDNVSVCAGAVVIGRIKIGDDSIVGANATVTKDVPQNVVVVGNPAKVIVK